MLGPSSITQRQEQKNARQIMSPVCNREKKKDKNRFSLRFFLLKKITDDTEKEKETERALQPVAETQRGSCPQDMPIARFGLGMRPIVVLARFLLWLKILLVVPCELLYNVAPSGGCWVVVACERSCNRGALLWQTATTNNRLWIVSGGGCWGVVVRERSCNRGVLWQTATKSRLRAVSGGAGAGAVGSAIGSALLTFFLWGRATERAVCRIHGESRAEAVGGYGRRILQEEWW